MKRNIQTGLCFLALSLGMAWTNVVYAKEVPKESVVQQEKARMHEREKTVSSDKKETSNVEASTKKSTHKEKIKAVTKEKQVEKVRIVKAIQGHPLSENDFMLSGVSLGGDIHKIIALKGKPEIIAHDFLRNEYHWPGLTIVVQNKDPYNYANRQDVTIDKKISLQGIISFYVDGESAVTARGIDVGDLRENVLRAYGIPTEVLWDGIKKEFLLRYISENKGITFTIQNNKVTSILISALEKSKKWDDKRKKGPSFITKKDFRLAGFTIGDRLSAYPWDTWEKKITNAREETWYYSGYAVKVTAKDAYIETVFLSDNQMLSSRGLTLGDDISTAELLYGKPHKMELDVSSGHPRTSYIYFSRDQRYILILFFTKQKVDGVLVTRNPQFKEKK